MKMGMAAAQGRLKSHRWSSPTREQTVFIGLEYSPQRLLFWQSSCCGVVGRPTDRAVLDTKCLSGWRVFSHPASEFITSIDIEATDTEWVLGTAVFTIPADAEYAAIGIGLYGRAAHHLAQSGLAHLPESDLCAEGDGNCVITLLKFGVFMQTGSRSKQLSNICR